MQSISLASETISEFELSRAAEFLTSGKRLTKGEETLRFEEEFAAAVGAKHAVFVNSGSSANLLAVAALKESGRLRNNIAVCPAVSWVTTVTPLMHLGFDVILCDSEAASLGVDPEQLERIFRTSRPSLLVLVHVLGHPNDLRRILELCREYDVLLVEDTCEALGTISTDNLWLGTAGVAGTFSFYYGHHISTIEGGMVVTSDFDLWQLMLSMRSHGWSRDLSPEVQESLVSLFEVDEFRNLYTFYSPGFNFRSTDFQAFIGRMQLERLADIVTRREENFEVYARHLPGFWRQSTHQKTLSSFAFGTAVQNRVDLARTLLKEGIESRPLVCGNIGRHPFWTKRHQTPPLPVADFVHDQGMYLPNHASLSAEDVERVANVLLEVGKPAFPGTEVP